MSYYPLPDFREISALAERVKALEALVTAQHEAIGELVGVLSFVEAHEHPEYQISAVVTRICDRYRAAMEEAGWPDA